MTAVVVQWLAWVQVCLGLAIVGGALALAVGGVDKRSPLLLRLGVVGLLCWGAWFGLLGWAGRPDSLPAQAFALAVAYVVVVRGRQLRGILDGEPWWPPHSKGAPHENQ
jgi:hypothetical protein